MGEQLNQQLDWTTGGGGGASFASPLAVSGVTFALGDGKPRLLITPRPASAIRISRIYYNSPGSDTATNKSLNAEFVRLTNPGRTVRQLRGWSVSDSDRHLYRFGRVRLRPGGSVTFHSGRGRDTPRDRHWNRRGHIWDNTRELVRVHTARGRLADQCRCCTFASPAPDLGFRLRPSATTELGGAVPASACRPPATRSTLPLLWAGGPEQKPDERRAQLITWSLIRESRSRADIALAIKLGTHA